MPTPRFQTGPSGFGHPASRPALWLTPFLPLLFTACASPLCVAPGTPEAQVVARFGPPSAEYRSPDGSERVRLEYDTAPLGRRTYMVDFGPDGRALRARQVLTTNHFAEIRVDVDTADSIRREFGQPDRIVPSRHGPGYARWDYPFFEDGVWNSIMSITLDPKGRVRSVENGPDPRYLGGK